MAMDASAHCAAIVRAGNRDRYLSDLFAPDAVRADLFALHAFDVEVSSVRDKVKEPTLGEIRLEWWRQALRGDHGGNPVAAALALTIARHGLPIAAFDNLLQARIFDLYDDPMPTSGDLEGYAGDTESALIQLAAIILAGGKDPGTGEAAGYAGVALGLARSLAALPMTAARGQCFLPLDRLTANGATPSDLRAGNTTAAVRSVFEEVVGLARERLAAARRSATDVDRTILPAFLPATIAEPMLARMAAPGFDPLHDAAELSPLRRQWIIWRAARRGSF